MTYLRFAQRPWTGISLDYSQKLGTAAGERERERAARQWSRGSEFELSSFSCSPSGHVGHTIPGKVVINRANAFNLFAVRVHQATDNVDYVDDNSVGDVGTQNSAQVKELCRKG